MDLYRPYGMEWFQEGYWAVNDQEDTARQFLDIGSQPLDNTPPLNNMQRGTGLAYEIIVMDPGNKSHHKACTLEFFINNRFDFLVATIPAHVPIFKELIAKYQPHAKLIIQMGNNWSLNDYPGHNILASVAPQFNTANTMFYHQEFDLTVFNDTPVQPVRKIYSFLNVIQNSGIGWNDYRELKRILERHGWEFRAYGGQCPDGNMNGAHQLASKMREAAFIFHVKPGGDGFGHIIHNAYAVGRPVITRPSHYRGQLAEQLLVPGTFIDLDKYGRGEVKNILTRLIYDPDSLVEMGKRAASRFDEVVDYDKEAKDIGVWLENLL